GGLENGLHDELRGTAAGDAVERRADPASLAVHAMAFGALALALGIGKNLPADFRIACQIRLPGGPGWGPLQASNEEHQLGALVGFQGIAQFLHGGFGNAIADNLDNVFVPAAAAEFFSGQIRSLASSARAAVTTAAQATKQRLSLGQGGGVNLGLGRF